MAMGKGQERLERMLRDPGITEIMINGPGKTFVEIGGRKRESPESFAAEEIQEILELLFTRAGKEVSSRVPYANVCLPDGSRANVIIAPLARQGTVITIRKFSLNLGSLDDLIRAGTLDRRMADFLSACICGKLNIIFSGATGAGKTTTLEILAKTIPGEERVITIEDTAELKLHHPNLVALETRTGDAAGHGEVTIRELIKNSLRMRPDRLIIGEVRGEEALDMVQAMTTGHKGILGVIHGSSPKEVVSRLETMILTAGINLPLEDIRKILADTIDLIVQQEQHHDGVRRITHITEVIGLHHGMIELHDLFSFVDELPGPDGRIQGRFQQVIKNYPRFYTDFIKQGLLHKDFFSDSPAFGA